MPRLILVFAGHPTQIFDFVMQQLTYYFNFTGLKCKSALFRHEIAYVLGQMQHDACVKQLTVNLQDEKENPMVRHECAEALGSIATEECRNILRNYLQDKERVVKESCVVALDMCDYENSEDFQYADTLAKLKQGEGLISS